MLTGNTIHSSESFMANTKGLSGERIYMLAMIVLNKKQSSVIYSISLSSLTGSPTIPLSLSVELVME